MSMWSTGYLVYKHIIGARIPTFEQHSTTSDAFWDKGSGICLYNYQHEGMFLIKHKIIIMRNSFWSKYGFPSRKPQTCLKSDEDYLHVEKSSPAIVGGLSPCGTLKVTDCSNLVTRLELYGCLIPINLSKPVQSSCIIIIIKPKK